MKLQFEPARIRVRVDESELARLQGGETLWLDLSLGGPQTSPRRFGLALGDRGALRWEHTPDCDLAGLPMAPVAAYVAHLPCREGLVLPLDANDAREFEFSVDVRDSVRQRGPRKRSES